MVNGLSNGSVSDRENVHAMIASNNSVRAYHTDLPGIWGGKFSQRRNSASRHFVPDFQGHTRLLLDAAGAVTDTLVPSAWGVDLARTCATAGARH